MIERIVANGHGMLRNPKYLAIHSTANPGAPAINHVSLWSRQPMYAVHAVSDWNEAYHTVPYDRLCYQVGNGNSTCIGIEICEATDYDGFMRGMEIAKDAIWEMLDYMGWGIDRLRSHDWFSYNYGGSDHTDPVGYLARFGKDWNWFLSFIEEGDMPSAKEIAQEVWAHGIYNKPAWERLYLCNVMDYSTDDPTGRGIEMNDHDHIKFMAAKQQAIYDDLAKLEDEVDKVGSKLDELLASLSVKLDKDMVESKE